MRKSLLAFAMTLITITSFAYDVEIDGIYYNLNAIDNTAEVTNETGKYSSKSYSGEIAIPEQIIIDGVSFTVTSIGEHAFAECVHVKSVVIPNSVTSIGEIAFYNCSGLSSVTIPSSVMTIGSAAFYGCNNVKELIYAEGTTTIYNTSLTSIISVTIPNTVTNISSYAFKGCSRLASVIIPNSVTSIGEWAFYGCSSLTSVDIPNTIESVDDFVFGYCSSLTTVDIPNSVKSIGEGAFEACEGLTKVTIPNSVVSIGQSAFSRCYNLTSVYIDDVVSWCSVRFCDMLSNPLYYAHHLYNNGEEIKELIIPDSVETIGDYAFSGCSGLELVNIHNSVKHIGYCAFYGCTGLNSPLYNDKFFIYMPESFRGNYIIPDGIVDIVAGAFYDCSNLTSVTIPSSVSNIGFNAFSGCTGLTSPLYNDKIFAYLPENYRGGYSIPDGIVCIAAGAFYDCSTLTSVNIPNSMKSIGDGAFEFCI